MKNNISDDNFGILCICALRYCQGRQTYMPDLVRGITRRHFSNIRDSDLQTMIEDCEFQERMKLWGDEKIDKPGWVRWKEELLIEQEKRKQRNKHGKICAS